MIIDKVFIQIRASVTCMQYGEAKWIIYPLDVKVRLSKGPFNEDDQIVLSRDYCGIEHLRRRLSQIECTRNNVDLVSYQLEALDKDWKSKHLDCLIDLWGKPEDYDQ